MKVTIKDPFPLGQQTFSDNEKKWFVSRLIEKAKDLPVEWMPMTALNTYRLAPGITSMNNFVGHIQKVLDADLEYPIILDEEGYVMDGRHRIAKALLEGHEEIKFVRFEETPGPDITGKEDEK